MIDSRYTIKKNCEKCLKEFNCWKYKIKNGEGKFCSKACASSVTRNSYKGSMKYRAVHHWIERLLGKPNKCEMCDKIGYGHKMHWSSKSHKYVRDAKDWQRLCTGCHATYDKNLTKNI